MGATKGKTPGGAPGRGAPGALDPSTALTPAEAASLAGVEPAEIEARIEDGTLLSERQRTRGLGGVRREKVVVRLLDLADVYPAVLGRPERAPVGEESSAPPSDAESEGTRAADPTERAAGTRETAPEKAPEGAGAAMSDAAAEPEPEPAPETEAETEPVPEGRSPVDTEREYILPRPDESVGETVASGVPRDALVQLVEDLETRLDLAEKERQASTASLLMAQRRVLDLEADARRRPWRGAATAAAVLASTAAVVLSLRAPARAAEAAHAATLPIAERVDAALEDSRRAAEERDARATEALRALGAEGDERIASFTAALAEAVSEARAAGVRTDEALAGLAARADARDARTSEREEAEAEAERLAAAERQRLEARLDEAEALLERTREALGAERTARADDAAAFAASGAETLETVERLEAAITSEREALRTLAGALERERALRLEAERARATEAVEEDAGPWPWSRLWPF